MADDNGADAPDCTALYLRVARLPECHPSDFLAVQLSTAADDGSWGAWRTVVARVTAHELRLDVPDPYQLYRARAVVHADRVVEVRPPLDLHSTSARSR